MSKEQYSEVMTAMGLFPHVINCEVISGTSQAGFSDSIIIRVTTDNEIYSLRGWPPNTLPLTRLKGLHRLLDHLAATGLKTVAVPRPLPFAPSTPVSQQSILETPNAADSLGRIEIPQPKPTLIQLDDRYWQLEPWLPGEANFNTNPNAEKLASMMHELAAWHTTAASFQPTEEEKQWFDSTPNATSPAVVERSAILSDWLIQKAVQLQKAIQFENQFSLPWNELAGQWLSRFEAVSSQIESELSSAKDWLVPLQPCLRDVRHDHILFNNNQVTGIIDPSATRMESVASDLSRLLGSLKLKAPLSWELAIQEYETIRPLSINEKRLVPVLYRSGILLSGLSWLDRIFIKKETLQQPDRVFARVQHLYSLLLTL